MDKKVAVITDIHGNLEGLTSVLDDIKKRNINEIYCLGDIINIGTNSKECIDLLINNDVKTVLGNHEIYMLRTENMSPTIDGVSLRYYNWVKNTLNEEEMEYLKSSPLYYELNFGKNLYLSHYLINDINNIQPFEKSLLQKDLDLWKKYNNNNNIYIVGHLHEAFDVNEVDGIKNNSIIETNNPINIIVVDSAGLSNNGEVGYLVINVGKEISFERVKIPFDRNKFIDKVFGVDFPDKEGLLKKYNYYLGKKD